MQKDPALETAGENMLCNIPIAKTGESIGEVEARFVKKAKEFETIDYVYVVDESCRLRGVASVKELLTMRGSKAKIESIMDKELVTAHTSTHQERVVYLALHHKIKAVPVVDSDGKLLGVVPHNTILEMFNEETHEDLFKFGGIYHKVGKEYATINSSTRSMIRHRLPWLIIGVLGGAVTAGIVAGFEEELMKLLALAAFAPVLTYLSDAVGTQSETLAIRSMALSSKIPLRRYFFREASVAVVLGIVCGVLLGSIAMIGWGDQTLGLIVGASMFLSVLAAVSISTSLPFLFRSLKWDPAFASGPFATMISDMSTILIFFMVASMLLKNL